MSDIVARILTDASVRDNTAVEDELLREVVATAWQTVQEP